MEQAMEEDGAMEDGAFDIGHPAAADGGNEASTSLGDDDTPAAVLALVQQLPTLADSKATSARGRLLKSVLAKLSCRDGRTGGPVDVRRVEQTLRPLLRAAISTRSLRASTAAALLADLLDTDRGMSCLLKCDAQAPLVNGYQLFVQKTAGELRAAADGADRPMADIVKTASARWHLLSDKKRAKWKRRSERNKAAAAGALTSAKEAAAESATRYEYALPAGRRSAVAGGAPRPKKLGWRRMAQEADGFGAYYNEKIGGSKYRSLSQPECEAKLRRRWAKLTGERRADYARRQAETIDAHRRSHNQYSREYYRKRREARRSAAAAQSAITKEEVETEENGRSEHGDAEAAAGSAEKEKEDGGEASPKKKKKKAKSVKWEEEENDY